MKNLIIIPAYNEQESIEKTVEDIKANAPSFDYIVVNDCSKDNTGKICKEKKYNVINLPVNLGIGGLCGSCTRRLIRTPLMSEPAISHALALGGGFCLFSE